MRSIILLQSLSLLIPIMMMTPSWKFQTEGSWRSTFASRKVLTLSLGNLFRGSRFVFVTCKGLLTCLVIYSAFVAKDKGWKGGRPDSPGSSSCVVLLIYSVCIVWFQKWEWEYYQGLGYLRPSLLSSSLRSFSRLHSQVRASTFFLEVDLELVFPWFKPWIAQT